MEDQREVKKEEEGAEESTAGEEAANSAQQHQKIGNGKKTANTSSSRILGKRKRWPNETEEDGNYEDGNDEDGNDEDGCAEDVKPRPSSLLASALKKLRPPPSAKRSRLAEAKAVDEMEEEEEEKDDNDDDEVVDGQEANDDVVGKKKEKKPSSAAQPESSADKIKRMMANMGYKEGAGLGKNKQGRVEPVSASLRTQFGRRALGADTEALKQFDDALDAGEEIKSVEERPSWLKCSRERSDQVAKELSDQWIVTGKPKLSLDDEDRFCEPELIAALLDAKSVFDTVDERDLNAARERANPYETIKAGFFQNRAAMKMANLDKIFEWRLSREFDAQTRLARNPMEEGRRRHNANRNCPLFYFADVCAGPGGFSEYMLWRKAYYNSKGFGFTLAGRDDFKLDRFKAASPEYFEPYYGIKDDGNVMDPENLESLAQFVRERVHAKEKGVHLVMCDGGFSVRGQENIQEILSKRLYLCQFITGLSLCRVSDEATHRRGGNFLCKLFDLFTPFSMGLVYLMYASFERISMHKPITSRPANSERYIFCENLQPLGATRVLEHLLAVNNQLHGMDPKRADVLELVPDEVIQADAEFMQYMRDSNEQIARRQIFYLRKYRKYAMEPGVWDRDQAKLREEALRYWELPDFIERVPEPRRSGGGGRQQQQQQHQLQQWEPAATTLQRYAGNQLVLPIKVRFARLTAAELLTCPDLDELRALLLPEAEEPALLISQGHDRLFLHKRTEPHVDSLKSQLDCTVPKDTILLVQRVRHLYKLKEDGKADSAGKCLWVLDAAVLNGDDVSQLELKDRLAAARKFCDAINRRHIRTAIFEQHGSGQRRWSAVTGHRMTPCCPLLVVEPLHMGALAQQQRFDIRPTKDGRRACFSVWTGDEPREEGKPSPYYLPCRAVRVLNKINPNFMLQAGGPDPNGPTKMAVPRVAAMFSQLLHQNPHTSFYESFIGHMPKEHLITSFPMGHPHNGAITFHWSWEPDESEGFQVDNLLHDPEHRAGLTVPKLRQIVAERRRMMAAAAAAPMSSQGELVAGNQ